MKALVLAASLLMAGPSIVAGRVLRSVLESYERAGEEAARAEQLEEAAAHRAEAVERRRGAA